MKEKIITLSDQKLEMLKKHFQILTFNSDFDLIYESQIPNTGIILLSGEIYLTKNNKMKSLLEPGSVVGFYNLLNNEPVEFGYRVKGNSDIILIQKLEMIEALTKKTSPLHTIVKKIPILESSTHKNK